MERPVPRHPPQAVLEHLEWVRELAAALTGDPVLAEDASQEVALAAVRRPPPADRSLRGWLAGTLRNVLRHGRRSEMHRSARERAAARREALPSTAELLEKVGEERRLVELVLALDEPYRTTVLLRWFEGLSPAQIARRKALPVGTVKTRLRRALARLRAELDRRHGGDGRSWLLALLPLVPERGGLAAAAGALAVNAKTILVPTVVAAAALAAGT